MPQSAPVLNPELIARLANLRVRARRVVDGVLTGLHKSPHHGSSIEFAEHKEYSPGDDIRHIDWKAFARFDRYYVKKFEDETNLRCYLFVDRSASMGYGEGDEQKLDYARVLSAALAYLLLRQQDSPGMVTFGNKIEAYIPPRATSTHYQELLESLIALEPEGKTDLAHAMEQAAELLRGRSMVIVLSDFFDPDGEMMRLLAQIRARKNDVALIQVLHRDEIAFPFDFLAQFEDPEGGETVLADPDTIRAEYLRVFGQFIEDLRQECLAHGLDYVRAITDEPPEETLLRFLKGREGPQ